MMITGFSVKCIQCGYINKPDRSPRTGILKVLLGEFDSCMRCGTKFQIVEVPNRPLVQELTRKLQTVSPAVKIFNYSGKIVPMAHGVV